MFRRGIKYVRALYPDICKECRLGQTSDPSTTEGHYLGIKRGTRLPVLSSVIKIKRFYLYEINDKLIGMVNVHGIFVRWTSGRQRKRDDRSSGPNGVNTSHGRSGIYRCQLVLSHRT